MTPGRSREPAILRSPTVTSYRFRSTVVPRPCTSNHPGSPQSTVEESFAEGLLEAPHYTRPPEFRGWPVPEVLVSGNHGEVAKWRRLQNILLTAQRRPELLASLELTAEEGEWLALQLGEQ